MNNYDQEKKNHSILKTLAMMQLIPHCTASSKGKGKEQAMKAQRGSRGIALLFLNLSARWGWVVNTMPWPLYPQERKPVPIVQETG
jgi:catalase